MKKLFGNKKNAVSGKNICRCKSILYRIWLKIWKGNPPGPGIFSFAAAVAVIMIIPVLYIIIRGAKGGLERWVRLLDSRIPLLLQNTLSLTFVVTIFAIILGLTLAWLVIRTDLPGRRIWQWLLAFPLVIPPYVGAITYIIIFGPTGWIREWLNRPLFPIYSFSGTAFVLTMFTYPYLFLIISAALKRMNLNYEEAALSAGLTYKQVFFKVVLPILRPAIGAGSILVSLYVLSDFGAVSILRYTTFTTAIYYQIGGYDLEGATILSMVLILIALGFIWLEVKTREKKKFYLSKGTFQRPGVIKLGIWKIPLLGYVLAVLFAAVILPLSVLIYWSFFGITRGVLDYRFFGYIWNSLYMAGLAAFLCMLLSLPVVYLKSRYPSFISSLIDKLAYSGYNLPGVIVALGIIFIFNRYVTFLYGTVVLVIFAYIIRFLPQSLQAEGAGLSLVSTKLDEAGRSLGYPGWKVMFKIVFPLIKPSIFAGGALVFVSVIKELQATLLLRPAGFDTLSVRIWMDASEGFYQTAAPAALLIVLVSIIPLKWMLSIY